MLKKQALICGFKALFYLKCDKQNKNDFHRSEKCHLQLFIIWQAKTIIILTNEKMSLNFIFYRINFQVESGQYVFAAYRRMQ